MPTQIDKPFPTTFREAVRHRPGYYTGGNDSWAVSMLVCRVIAGRLADYFRAINVTILSDLAIRLVCTDWIPASPSTETPHPLFGLFNDVDAGSRSFFLKDENYLPVLNTLSTKFEIEICADGEVRQQNLEKGLATGEPVVSLASGAGGADQCIITASLDPDVFSYAWFVYDPLARQLEEVAAQFPGLKIRLYDERNPTGSLDIKG